MDEHPRRQAGRRSARVRRDAVTTINPRGFHRIAYREWTCARDRSAVVCVHGLTRHGEDFVPLARELAGRRRVIVPDLVGRGDSDWLPDPSDYHVPQFNCDLTALIARSRCASVDFVGTSLGGLCGIVMAGLENTPIRRLVVNDVAPEIPIGALRRVNGHLSNPRTFSDLGEAETELRSAYSGFGPMSDDDWTHMTQTSVRPAADGGLALHYDPMIGRNFRNYWLAHQFKLWKFWDRIECPILILAGEDSDFLTPELIDRMLASKPHAEVKAFPGVGHTPTLNDPDQIGPIVAWLTE